MKTRIKKEKTKKVGKFLYWTPRILSIIFILFVALFSLDTFDACKGFSDCLLGLFMHNIPSLILLAVLIISWKKEIVGAIGFALFAIILAGFYIFNFIKNPTGFYFLSYILIMCGPPLIVAYLWYLNWKRKK